MLDSQHTNTMACLETLRFNAHKAALVESMGIIFSKAALLPLNLLEELGFVIHNATKLRHLDLDWICPANMDDPGLKVVNSILTIPSLSLTTLHCGGEVDFARIVQHNQSLEFLGIHHARLDDDELRISFLEMFVPTENPQNRRTRLQPYYPKTAGDEKGRYLLPHIFLLSSYGKSRETLHHGITMFPGLYPTMLDGMVQKIFDHLTSHRVRNTYDLISKIEFAQIHWLALPPFPITRRFFTEFQSCFPWITSLAIRIKGDMAMIDFTKLRDSICVMSQLECLSIFEWETEHHAIVPWKEYHSSAEARLEFVMHWGAMFPKLTTMYALDGYHMSRVDGKWTQVIYN
ncbi:hypothetical protein HYPSUDRAFT_92082 [Hypholoma sublateritium FD-334 SS-4]|uniref:Uncharacterized protein n=1 Tax=Hypholoma sublateritium (strain FD-334 SS-4) TaxID=945553 RepID=A0A0D2N7S8_HYPSF|nr:hypothetical protein HYPSUDRAFT_92082 [Hypholoma sublateritium FD-334 SS-4]